MSEAPIFVDVNVPMYAAGQAHPHKDASVWVMKQIAEGRIRAAIDTEIIQEILYRYGTLKRWEIAVVMANNLLDVIPTVYPVLLSDARLAVKLFDRYAPGGVKARDLIHCAVMMNHGLAEIISADSHFDQIEGIKRLDPLTLFEQRDHLYKSAS